MSNVNTFTGFMNLPVVTAPSTAVTTYKVPAAAGTYAGLPSPSQIAGNALVISAMPGDTTPGCVTDYGRPFRVRVNGQISPAQSEAFTLKVYQCTAAAFATGFTAATGTGQNVLTSTGLTGTETAADNFFFDVVLMWDSVSKLLNGYSYGQLGNQTFQPILKTTQVTAVNEKDLNFYFSYAFASTGTGDTIGPLDFTIDRF